MWSDRAAPERLQELVEALRSVVPVPPETAAPVILPLDDAAKAAEIAAALQAAPGFVWLDSPGSHKLFARPVLRLSVREGEAVIEGPDARLALRARGFEMVEAAAVAWGQMPGAMLCGYLGYELGAESENIETPSYRNEDPPDLVLGLYDHWFVRDAAGWMMAGTDAWRDVASLAVLPRGCPLADCLPRPPVASTPDESGFCEAVRGLVQRIYAGEVYQVVLCRRLETALAEDEIWPLYLRMREISPADYGAFLRLGPGCAVLSLSPELFLRVDDGEIRSYPIKGTRPRGATAEEDAALAADLLDSGKDRAELAMIVDVTRNDLGRVCAAGTVRVGSHAELMTLPTVHHTVSKIVGQLRPDVTLPDVLRACSPAASISGAPKIRAIELAAAQEGFRRGPCMGSIGWISLDGRMELSVAIRTAVASAGRLWYLAGCGITAESEPRAEFAESQSKAAAFERALAGGATPPAPPRP